MTTKAIQPFKFVGSVNGNLCDATVTWSTQFAPDSGYSADDLPAITPSGSHILVSAPLVEDETSYGPVSPGTLTLTPTVSYGEWSVELSPLVLTISLN